MIRPTVRTETASQDWLRKPCGLPGRQPELPRVSPLFPWQSLVIADHQAS